MFLSGFVHTENMRFRDEELTFKVAESVAEEQKVPEKGSKNVSYRYPQITKTQGDFKLVVEAGSFSNSEIVVMLGQNGTGKTTLIKLLAGILKPDEEDIDIPRLNVIYKP